MSTEQFTSGTPFVPGEKRTSRWLPALLIPILATLTTAGCKVGPDYCGAPAPLNTRWIDADVDPRICGQPEDTSQWWNKFNDPTLTSLIRAVETQNPSLRGAAFRIQAARSARGIAAGSLFPQSQTASGNYTRLNNSQTVRVPPPIADFDNWGLTVFDAQWELDFWGKFRRNIEAAEGDLQASIASYDDILVSLQAEVAAAYIQLRTLQYRLQLAEGNVSVQEGSFDIADAQFKNGAVSELDVTQARQSLAQTNAAIPTLEAGIRSSKNALCVLIGTTPGELDGMLDAPAGIPVPPESICVGVPSELLQRRPDIRAAWHAAAAQSASIGVAITDLYPSFIIAGDIGYQSANLSNLFNTRSVVGAAGPAFNWKILNYGRIKNNIRLQEDLLQSDLATYQQTVLSAYQEVEDGLIRFSRTQAQIDQLEIAAADAKKSVDIALSQYQNGAIDFNRVFTLQLNLAAQQDALAASQGELATQLVAVYKALGGGWRARTTGYSMPAAPMPMRAVPADPVPDPVPDAGSDADDQAAPKKEPLPEPPPIDPDTVDARSSDSVTTPENVTAAETVTAPENVTAPKDVSTPDVVPASASVPVPVSATASDESKVKKFRIAAPGTTHVQPVSSSAPERPDSPRAKRRELIPRFTFLKKTAVTSKSNE